VTYQNHDRRMILLIDQNRTKRELRATILRNYEIEVHTACTLTQAATLWARHSYDVILLAAQPNSQEAIAATAQIRQIRPRQRIALLVGPPAFVQELSGGGRKAASISMVTPSRAVEDPSVAGSAPQTSPQWQEMISKLVSDWYVNQNAVLRLPG